MYPVMKQAKRDGKMANTSRDKLFIDDELYLPTNEIVNQPPQSQETIHKWNKERYLEFQNKIDLRKIDELKKLLNEVTSLNLIITEANLSVDKSKISSLLYHLCTIFLSSAKSTFGTSEYS